MLHSRRSLIQGTLGAAAATTTFARAQAATTDTQAHGRRTRKPNLGAFHTEHQLRALPYKASALVGLSERLIESHWKNNYGGSVRALNATNQRLRTALADATTPAFTYNDLKREHLLRTGSVVLHELYFDTLGGNGRAPAKLRSLIAEAFGTFDQWEVEFRRIAAGLGGGSGWVVFGYNTHFGALENYWMADHMHAPTTTVPLVVMDMYEHSYHMDYGAAAARYIDAFFKNINWEVAEARLLRAA